ncbi:MAG: lipocalin family protein [Spirochaetia bacterium]|nr:lipocalin family protein [Spirochaetia bacterium]
MNINVKSSFVLFLIAGLTILTTHIFAGKIDSTTVKNVDISRYLGTWYEIARFPHSFEKNLDRVTANYSMREDGKIKVINKGYLPNGKLSEAVGKAYTPNPKDLSRLKVSFFLFFYGDYFILELDDKNYSWAMIGSSNDHFLWILSRTPELDEKTYNMLLANAKNRGYDLSKLIKVNQK